MIAQEPRLFARFLGLAAPLASFLACPAAFASNPLPGDAVAPPSNINIALYYNEFTDSGAMGTVQGVSYAKNTHISADIQIARYVRTFTIDGVLSGVQAYIPYVSFLGGQEAGIPQAGPFGPGHASLSHSDGFGQPVLGVFAYPLSLPATGTSLVVGPWVTLPLGTSRKTADLTPGPNVWSFDPEAGFRTTLLGSPTGRNLALEVWGSAYFFSADKNASANAPAIYANSLRAAFNPIQAATSAPATFHEQPSEELRIYLPYEIFPKSDAFIAPGFYQSFGGKQTYRLSNGATEDTGIRTNETQLRLIASTYLTPHFAVMAIAEYDLAAHGAPLSRNLELRLGTLF
ncbi:MAG: hypothetical protein B7X08_03320 [Acidocella sp. 20-63-7]|nr:MAG: hypothetical protein B7X08_03320 [Acidocella sp. 20-63-7]HQT47853.1 transporter [Acidocella sp.]